MRKITALLAVCVVLAVAAELYLAFLGFNFHYLAEVEKHEAKVAPFLRSCVRSCGWGLERGLYPSSEDRTALETVWPNGQRASRPSNSNLKTKQRVLLLGCSYIFGSGLDDQDTLAWRLNQKYPHVQFDNYGVPGWGTYQCLMLEETLLKDNSYDLVIYGAINDHRNRNTEYKFVGSLRPGQHYALYPRVELHQLMYCPEEAEAASFIDALPDEPEQLHLIPADAEIWPGQFYFRSLDFLRRVWVGRRVSEQQQLYACSRGNFDHFMPAKEKIFWLLVQKMASQAKKNGSRFALAFLEGDPKLWRYCPLPDRLPYDYWLLSWPSITSKQFRIASKECNHPNGAAQQKWLEKISPYLENIWEGKRP
ncbi:MAG: hypothetical protein ACI376_01120 [Candidatus Bruticola sp.]